MVANRGRTVARAGNGILTRMAKDQFSFDIVSEVDLQEVRNAVDQAQREISQRFDFKDTETGISQDHTTIELRSLDRGPAEGRAPGPEGEDREARTSR